MNLIPQTTFTGTPDDIKAAIVVALVPYAKVLIGIDKRVQPLPFILSVARIAQDCCCGRETVRQWIVKERKIPGWTTIMKLRIINRLTDGSYLVRLEDYENFLERLPTVRAQSKSMSLVINHLLID